MYRSHRCCVFVVLLSCLRETRLDPGHYLAGGRYLNPLRYASYRKISKQWLLLERYSPVPWLFPQP